MTLELAAIVYLVIGFGCATWLYLSVPRPDESVMHSVPTTGMAYFGTLIMMVALWPVMAIPFVIIAIRKRGRSGSE